MEQAECGCTEFVELDEVASLSVQASASASVPGYDVFQSTWNFSHGFSILSGRMARLFTPRLSSP